MEATQPSTQQVLDPRRLGRNNSGLREGDVSDVLCILHPGSPAAFRIVSRTAQITPQHVLQNWTSFDADLDEQTFIVRSSPENAQDLALRFSSTTKQQHLGFIFGRNPRGCDIVLVDELDNTRRISNCHFRIFVKENGVLMLEDQSTNGTLVDDNHIKGRGQERNLPCTRVLENGSTIAIPSPNSEQRILFHVRIPAREGYEDQFRQRFVNYLNKVAAAAQPAGQQTIPTAAGPSSRTTLVITSNSFGMKWDGGSDYRVSGFLGKGAFANVYRLTTCMDGTYLAVKELEKRRFVKDGVLDRRLSNEMAIMKSVTHPRIVKYMDYRDINDHLYIIMEYVPCGDLQQYLKSGPLTEFNAKVVARQVLDALAYLHENNITHRDIKPDNILIENEDPISIKLSDFGLSKVKTDETFLKTFCGTLLYCAPEVFPHYQNDKLGTKRRHSKKSYSYDHAVDIWSLGGVLWFAMTSHPPFEGVVDPTGRGMYDKITQTELNMNHLRDSGISADATDLLSRMLTVQPDQRPSAFDCLNHSWLYDGKTRIARNTQLNSIVEEVEEAKKFSQLSLYDDPARGGAAQEDDDFSDFDLDEYVVLEANRSRTKRIKTDARHPRNQIRDNPDKESSDDILAPESFTPDQLAAAAGKRRLFGEIGVSALADSGVLGQETKRALTVNPKTQTDMDGVIPTSQPPDITESYHAAESLCGTASLVGNLNMASPISSDWHSSPGSSANSVPSAEMPDRQIASYSSEETPRAQISKYESQDEPTPTRKGRQAVPDTMYQPSPDKISDSPVATHAKELTPQAAEEFASHPPRYGTLITTEDSDQSIFLPLNNRLDNWGRVPSNTLVYHDNMDTRIPKRAFALMYDSPNIALAEKAGTDWTTLPDLRVWIIACSSQGVWVNGVRLEQASAKGEQLYGLVYSGDVITILQPKDSETASGECLRFVCTFYLGEARLRRQTPFTAQVLSRKSARPTGQTAAAMLAVPRTQ